jgi:hypothetical protein
MGLLDPVHSTSTTIEDEFLEQRPPGTAALEETRKAIGVGSIECLDPVVHELAWLHGT